MSEENRLRNTRAWFLEACLAFLRGRTSWKGTPTELAAALYMASPNEAHAQSLPEARGIAAELANYAADLAATGWTWSQGKTHGTRWISLWKGN